MASIKEISISGAKWMTLSTLFTSVAAILRLSILARFLDKSDFGLIAILTFIIGLTSMFSDMGFSTVVLHKQDMSRKQFSSLYWIQLLIYTVLALGVMCFTHPISLFYNEPALNILIPLILLDLPFMGIGKLYEAVLQKNFQFRVIALRNIISCILSLILAVVMAATGCGVYSLVASTLFATLFPALWNFIVGQKQVKLECHCTIRDNLPLIKIGLYQTGTQIVDYLCTKLDVLIIGKLLGMEVLGAYNLSKELIFRFIQIINSIVNKVLAPAFSKIQDDKDRLRSSYCTVMRFLTSITFPVIALVIVLGTPIMVLFYGESYAETGLLTSLLAVAAVGTAVGNPVGNIIVATGRTDLTFKYVWTRAIVTIPIVYLTAMHSIIMVAVGQIVLAIIDYWLQWQIEIKPAVGLNFKELTMSFVDSGLLMLALGIGGFFAFSQNPLSFSSSIIQIVIYGGIIAVAYILAAYIFTRKSFDLLLSLSKNIIK